MSQIVGIIILIIVSAFIIYMRNLTKQKGGPVLNTALKVNDTYVWIRFIGGIVPVLLLLFFLMIFRKK